MRIFGNVYLCAWYEKDAKILLNTFIVNKLCRKKLFSEMYIAIDKSEVDWLVLCLWYSNYNSNGHSYNLCMNQSLSSQRFSITFISVFCIKNPFTFWVHYTWKDLFFCLLKISFFISFLGAFNQKEKTIDFAAHSQYALPVTDVLYSWKILSISILSFKWFQSILSKVDY